MLLFFLTKPFQVQESIICNIFRYENWVLGGFIYLYNISCSQRISFESHGSTIHLSWTAHCVLLCKMAIHSDTEGNDTEF